MPQPKKSWVEVANGIQSIATTAALCVGGIWAINLFIQNREAYPKMEISQSAHSYAITDEDKLVRVSLTLKNISKINISASRGNIRLHLVLPLFCSDVDRSNGYCIKDLISENKDPVSSESNTIIWPQIFYREMFDKNSIYLEPGEVHNMHYDFILPKEAEILEVYSFLKNDGSGANVGWSETGIYDLKEEQ